MTTQSTHTVSFAQPVETLYDALTNRAFWEKIATRFSGLEGEVVRFDTTQDNTTVVIRQTAPEKIVPEQIRAFVRGAAAVERTVIISPLSDGVVKATVTLDSGKLPLKFRADQTVTGVDHAVASAEEDAASATNLLVNYEFDVTVPLVGTKLEAKAAPYIDQVIEKEANVLKDFVR